ncbi:zinc finger protein 208-like isoform X6 [Pomacea canaliculata]|uniref:zinc finger protein 208-like isoform X6 n=1 Tax=Pomacea canaliculata TaxID=400727 RepID=UPI000D73075C|nr:zinc finger protein 208-like isoform X6 [Pomacea canaliculata]
MPQNPNLPLLKCDICGFSTKNHFIFSRHRMRCLRVNGGVETDQASDKFADTHALEKHLDLKAVLTSSSSDGETSTSKSDLALESAVLIDSKVSSRGKSILANSKKMSEEKSFDVINLSSSSKVSSKVKNETQSKQVLRLKTSLEEHSSQKTKSTGDKANLEDVEDDVPISELKKSLKDTSEGVERESEPSESSTTNLPPPNVSRNYRCNQCSFATTKSKVYLYHLIEQHRARISVFPCNFCEYASRYKHKLARHVTFAHKQHVAMNKMVAENLQPGTASSASKRVGVVSHKLVKMRKTASGLGSGKSRTLDSFLVKLRGKAKITDSSLAAFYTDFSIQQKQDGSSEVLGNQNGDLFKCNLCLFTGKSKNHVIRHIYACHINARLFRCNLCNFKTYSQAEFYTHKNKHSTKNATVHKCTECFYATDFKPNFERHCANHGSNRPNKCSLCNYATDHEGALKRHLSCHHANTTANVSIVSGDHDAEEHEGSGEIKKEPGDPDIEEGQDELQSDGFKCPICALVYRRCADLNRHMKSKHNVRRKDFYEDEDEEDSEEEGPVVLNDHEGIAFEDLAGGNDDDDESRPLSELLGKQKVKSLKCSYCSYIAKWPSDLRRHLRVHSVEKRFKCSMCWKKYKYLGDLNVHMRRDHEVSTFRTKMRCRLMDVYHRKRSDHYFWYPESCSVAPEKVVTIPVKKSSPSIFRCPACPFTTRWKAHMEPHSQLHKDHKAYECKLCDYQTYWRGDMGRHLYRHHPDFVSKEVELSNFFNFYPDRKVKVNKAVCKVPEEIPLPDNMESTDTKDSKQNENESQVDDSVSDTMSLPDSVSSSSGIITSKDGAKMFQCDHCAFTHIAPSKMRAHIETHLNLKQYKCPVCGRRANWKYDIRKHMKVEHSECKEDVITLSLEEAKATIKEYMDTMPNIRREHHLNLTSEKEITLRKVRRPYKCSLCGFRSQFRWSVSKHQRTTHPGQAGISIVVLSRGEDDLADGEKKNHGPSHTHETRQSNQSTEQKLQQGDVDMKEILKAGVEEEKRDMMYQCAECGKLGSSKGSIKKHYNYIHPTCEVRIVYLGDGVEFNYYTGMPVDKSPKISSPPSPSLSDTSSVGVVGLPDPKILNNPKEHGYVKPFKCSVCGQRSNWKWDLKKHLRVKHPGTDGFVIVMRLDEARATYIKYQRSFAKTEKSDPMNTESPTKVEEIIREVNVSTSTPSSKFGTSMQDMPFKSQEMMLGRYRRYKCSNCGYRSNWRTDIMRHIERRHKNVSARCIFMDIETAKETFMDYDYIPANASVRFASKKNPHPLPTTFQSDKSHLNVAKKGGPGHNKLWQCHKCSFRSSTRSHIVQHMQGHGLKPYHCSLCGYVARFRSPLYRHIRSQHKTSNYSAYAKVVIKYSKQPHEQIVQQGPPAVYIDAYLCRLCNEESDCKDKLLQHLQTKHGCEDSNQALKVRKRVGLEEGNTSNNTNIAAENGKALSKNGREKQYFCSICPYRTDKRGMLTFHHTYHQPSAQNKYKCRFCPYFVCAPRLLHQHMRWHAEYVDAKAAQNDLTKETSTWQQSEQNLSLISPKKQKKVLVENSTKRHNCEKCPYTTNSNNDFIYHQQFHRPKAGNGYNCQYCDYWVAHRRLLKQHLRLHDCDSVTDTGEGNSIASSPAKSLASDASSVYDAVELAALKQKMISTRITASLSTSPSVSPMKIATQCSIGSRPGFVLRNGSYHKLHQCRKCPYTNIRARNLRLHELMHGYRRSEHPLMKCPYCDYYVGSKGLLSHHMKVHLHQYVPDPTDSTTFDLEKREGIGNLWTADDIEEDMPVTINSSDIPQKQKVDTLLEISRFKKYSCEKCPYASSKRSHFTRHMELHGSRQRHTCEYCDYSVPSASLLSQHYKIHLMPNQNLLATQTFSNLQFMKEVPADVALASALPPTDSAEPVTISVVHDHLELYENDETATIDTEPRKLYRCDRCPYANVRRDHLLTHMRFHLHRSSFHCPYCDYSAPKQQLLTQHIRVHFCPLPELSDWLVENGQAERAQEASDIDLTQALEIAEKFQSSPKRKFHDLKSVGEETLYDCLQDKHASNERPAKKAKTSTEFKNPDNNVEDMPQPSSGRTSSNSALSDNTDLKDEAGAKASSSTAPDRTSEDSVQDSSVYICQYCDREFITSKQLIGHEMQHLIGNHFEHFTYLKKTLSESPTDPLVTSAETNTVSIDSFQKDQPQKTDRPKRQPKLKKILSL